MLKACFFDLDGTLINSIEDLAIATNAALRHCGLTEHTLDEYYHIVGNGVKTQIRRSVGEHQECFDECLNYFKEYYRNHCFANTIAYEGMIEVIKMLNSLKVQAICITNKPDEMAQKIIDHVYGEVIDVVFGGRDGIPVKPDPLSTNIILEQCDLLPEECLFIGDTYVDIETGHNAHMKTIGCLWGFRDINELQDAGADFIVATPEELGGLLNDLYERMSGRV